MDQTPFQSPTRNYFYPSTKIFRYNPLQNFFMDNKVIAILQGWIRSNLSRGCEKELQANNKNM
jgi:hypothetical protein